jgi:hypothetical protein
MAGHGPRSSYELDNAPYSKAVARRGVRVTIGHELGKHYEVPQDLPHGIVALLMQLNERDD